METTINTTENFRAMKMAHATKELHDYKVSMESSGFCPAHVESMLEDRAWEITNNEEDAFTLLIEVNR